MTDTGTINTDIYDPNAGGLIIDYNNNGVKMPIITYNPTTDSIIFNNPIVPANGISSSEGNLTFASPAIFNDSITVGYADPTLFIPMPLPSAPLNFSIPAIASAGTIQTTDIMVANEGVMKFYSDASGTHIYGDITVDGNIINTNLDTTIGTALTPYLTTALAASTYQPTGNYLTTASTIISSKISDLSTTISTALSPYLTTALAASTYQPTGNYLTTASTITSSKISDLATTISTALSPYLTTTLAASTYAPKASPTFTGTVSGITATMVGLANVNNTSDANKPISTATQAALNLLAPLTSLTNTPTTRVQFFCNATGGLTINGTGLYSVTLASYTTGTYAFTFSGSVSGYPMIQCLSTSASVNYNANLVAWSGSACTVVIKDSSNVLQSTPFWLTVLA